MRRRENESRRKSESESEKNNLHAHLYSLNTEEMTMTNIFPTHAPSTSAMRCGEKLKATAYAENAILRCGAIVVVDDSATDDASLAAGLRGGGIV